MLVHSVAHVFFTLKFLRASYIYVCRKALTGPWQHTLGSPFCQCCGQSETSNYLFQGCSLVHYAWRVLSCAFAFRVLQRTWDDWVDTWILGFDVALVGFAVLLLCVWNLGNHACLKFK